MDAEGVLTVQTFADPTGQLRAERIQSARVRLGADLADTSPLRKVSLRRLETAIAQRLASGQEPSEAMQALAGLTRLQYVFCYPATKDLVIAGPAEGFAADLAGRPCGIKTGLPVLRLQDLIVALRAFPPGGRPSSFVGCTIDPTPEALTRLQQMQQRIPAAVPQAQRASVGRQIAGGMQEALGMAPVRVFGIPADTDMARVLVEADYRMKRIGLGLEPTAARIPSYLDLLRGARHSALQRWWFVPDYECVKVTNDRLGAELVGQGVRLLSESKLVGADGQFRSGAPVDRASEMFAQAFTRKFPELAASSPVFGQLRNTVDLLIAAAFVQQQDLAGRIGWDMELLLDERQLSVQDMQTVAKAPAAVNATWKGNRFYCVAGGGVSIRPGEALTADNLVADEDGQLSQSYRSIEKGPVGRWWWD